jgi:excisionase family DNA binding protein
MTPQHLQGSKSASLLSPREVGSLLGVALATVYRLVERRVIAFVRIGGRLRFTPTDVDAYIEAARVKPLDLQV